MVVPVHDPRASIASVEAESNIIPRTASVDDIAAYGVLVVVNRAAGSSDDIEGML
jgi:hypothetical protein